MAYVSHTSGPSRYFDHVYDPIFEVSSQKDVWKANIQALQRSAPIQITSLFQTMFSDMPNRPSYMCWKRQNALPHFTYPETIMAKSDYALRTEQRKKFCVEGSSRCNFFHYPPECIKTLNLRLSLPAQCKCSETPKNKYENVGCQTIYRESSAQTRPYEPDFHIAEGEPQTPEVVRIANYISGERSPGEFDTIVIERLRKRHQWDKYLTPTKSAKEWDIRRTILEAFEWEEFLAREKDIQEIQELRMELVQNLVAKREFSMRASSAAKLEHASQRIEEERKEKLKKINNKFNRQLRKLECSRNKISLKYKAQNIVKEHIDQTSDLYAPQMRFGVHPKRLHFVPFSSSFQARLENLDPRRIEPKKLKCSIKKYDVLAAPKLLVAEIEKGFNNDKNLTKLHETLLALRTSSVTNKNLPNCLQKVHKKIIMETEAPLGPSEDLYEPSENHCCIHVQKIIKGRAIQKILYSGRDKCRRLIQEIQTTHMLSAVSAMYPGMSSNTIRGRLIMQSHQKPFMQKIQIKKQSRDIFQESEAGMVGKLLEFLEKELHRMYEQRRIHALCILAERERMKREAGEADRRQKENKRRQEIDGVYEHMMNASQDTISLYLENLLMEETEKAAEDEARKQIKATARYIDREVSESVDNKCQTIKTDANDQIIDDLVKHFMFPEVHKRIARKNTEQRRRRHLLAAHETLYSHIKNTFYNPPPRSSRSVIAGHIVNSIIDKIPSSESVLPKIGRYENVAQHEALAAIQKIIKQTFPSRKWESSAERVASATVSQLIHDIFDEKPQENDSLIKQESWPQDITKKEEVIQTKNGGDRVQDNNHEEKPSLAFAGYEIGEIVEDEESITNDDSKHFFLPSTFIEPQFFDIDDSSSEEIFAPFLTENINERSMQLQSAGNESESFPHLSENKFQETTAEKITNINVSHMSDEVPSNNFTDMKLKTIPGLVQNVSSIEQNTFDYQKDVESKEKKFN